MKRLLVILTFSLFLTGCGAEETFETIADQLISQTAAAGEIQIPLPANASLLTEDPGGCSVYFCDPYYLLVQTLQGGDMDRTIRELSGFSKDALTVIQTEAEGLIRWECVWSAAGEEEVQLCRAVILDDGTYHYAVTAMADYTQAGQLKGVWADLFDSVKISTD